MSETAALRIRKRRVTPYRSRGPIYNWLRAHAEQVRSLLSSGKATWPALCEEMVRHGVSGARGEPPTAPAAARVWPRVEKDLAAAAAIAPPKRLMPSRLAEDWRPRAVSTSAAASPDHAPVRLSSAGGSDQPRRLPPPPMPVYDTPPPAPVVVSNRTYERPYIPDDQLDLSLAPETYENEKGEIVPMPLDARRRIARLKMDYRRSANETVGLGGG